MNDVVAFGNGKLPSVQSLTTALRTAAMSAVAARSLAPPGAQTMALIGNGAQSEFQAIAFQGLVGVRQLRLFDIDPLATAKLVKNLQGRGLDITVCGSTTEAVQGAQIVTTVTADKTYATIITADMVRPGMHFNAVGGDCPGKTELAPEVLRRANVFVEFEPQSRIEGDIQQMPADFAVTELWQVLAGIAPGRRQADDVTVFDSVGFALEDYSALHFLHDTAMELGLGTRVPLMPPTDHPKDLFGALRHEAVTV